MTFPSSSKNVFVINEHLPFKTCTKIKYLLIAFPFLLKFLFLNSKYANFQAIRMNFSVIGEDFQRAR